MLTCQWLFFFLFQKNKQVCKTSHEINLKAYIVLRKISESHWIGKFITLRHGITFSSINHMHYLNRQTVTWVVFLVVFWFFFFFLEFYSITIKVVGSFSDHWRLAVILVCRIGGWVVFILSSQCLCCRFEILIAAIWAFLNWLE